jgi:hypothetical protein
MMSQSKPIIVLYHLYQTEGWEQLFSEQIGSLYISGLVDAATEIVISVIGNTPIKIQSQSEKFNIIMRDKGFAEHPTLILARDKAFEYPTARIMYFHSKGISHPTRNQDQWRMLVQYFTVMRWRDALDYLEEYDVVAPQWRDRPVEHPSGNYWWSNADFLRKLDPEYMGNVTDPNQYHIHRDARVKQEFWIGSVPGKVKNQFESNMNHYLESCPTKFYTPSYFDPPPLYKKKQGTAVMNRTITPMTLTEILHFHDINGHEKNGGTDKETFHSYGEIYEQYLTPLKDKDDIHLLEVGVQYGGSMLLWHDLLPKAKFVFLDIKNVVHESIFERMDSNRYDFFVENAYTPEAANKVREVVPQGLDFMIDDGPHTLDSQIQFLSLYLPLLRRDGVAIIEDIQDVSWYQELIKYIPQGFTYNVIDRRYVKGRYDDLMLAVKNDKIL